MYNPQNAKESAQLPQDAIVEGTISKVQDGKVKDFVLDTSKWTGDVNQPCINVTAEVTNKDKKIEVSQVFTYNDNNGVTEYAPKSNMGKFVKKYGKMPQVGVVVKISTNSDGFGKFKLD